jgi:two-component system cell cycle sensor histidine kinase/response regulator CckA
MKPVTGHPHGTTAEPVAPDIVRVLLVCANEAQVTTILKALVAADAIPSRVDRAFDLDTALGAVAEHRPDVILLHDSAAAATGAEPATMVAALRDIAPVILLTPPGAAGTLVRALEAGAAEHIPDESLSPLLLGRALRRVVERLRTPELAGRGEQGYPAVLGIMEEGVVLHAADGTVVACSAAAERILGISSARLAGSPSLFPGMQAVQENGAPLASEDEPARAALRTRQPCRGRTVKFRRPDGAMAWVSLSAGPLFHAAAVAPPGALTVILDITERKSLEHRLRGTHRMEAIGRLAGGVAHDFNNLLTAILGFSEILLQGLEPADPRRHEVEEVRKAARRATELTQQLLAFSRRQMLEPRVLDLNRVLSDMQAMLRRLIGEDIQLRVELAPALGTVRADRGQLEQVILNLAVNARDALHQGGELVISTANVELDQAFVDSHAGARPGRHVVLSVVDTGIGMEAETLAHIFEPFFTTKGQDKGTGLGLATVYGIVKQSEGYIDVESAPGQGTTFQVYLPHCDEVPDLCPPELPPAVPPRASGTVLLVEDDDQVRDLARRILEQQGYTVLAEANGLAALTVLESHSGPIDALVTDVVMPGLSGPKLARRAVERRPGMPVLYLSGYADEALIRHGALLPGVHLLPKPFHAEALVEKLREVLAAPAKG